MSETKIVIAIDGFSSCGKSTVAKSLARTLKYIYIDSGAMYRAVTLFALENKLIHNGIPDKEAIINSLGNIDISFTFEPQTEKNITFLNGVDVEERIRDLVVSQLVSPVSAIKEVRAAMVVLQQEMGRHKGIVMDGRDIGTVVFPNAELKIFMTADPAVRAQRRYQELIAKGMQVSFDEIQINIMQRDYIDQSREESPLRKADDAIVLDNSHMTIDEQLKWALQRVSEITGKNAS